MLQLMHTANSFSMHISNLLGSIVYCADDAAAAAAAAASPAGVVSDDAVDVMFMFIVECVASADVLVVVNCISCADTRKMSPRKLTAIVTK